MNWLKPNWLAIVFLSWFVIFQVATSIQLVNISDNGVFQLEQTFYFFCLTPCLKLVCNDGVTAPAGCAVKVYWHWLLLDFIVAYLVSTGASNLIRKKTRLRNIVKRLIATIAVVIFIAFISSALVSKIYWGYFFERPSLPELVFEFKNITAIVPIWFSKIQADGTLSVAIDTSYSIQERLKFCKKYPDECYNDRILLTLEALSILPSAFASDSLAKMSTLNNILRAQGVLKKLPSGWGDEKKVTGLLIDVEAKDGERYLFVALRGWWQISNDHYTFHEFLFRVSPHAAESFLVSENQFFVDMAGTEEPVFLFASRYISANLCEALREFFWVAGAKGRQAGLKALAGSRPFSSCAALCSLNPYPSKPPPAQTTRTIYRLFPSQLQAVARSRDRSGARVFDRPARLDKTPRAGNPATRLR